MAKETKKSSSCLGLFLKSFLATTLGLSLLTAGLVALGVKFMGLEAAHWTVISGWTSYPMIALYVVMALAFVTGIGLTAFMSAANAFLGRGRGRDRKPTSSAPSSRPQSQRKTTV